MTTQNPTVADVRAAADRLSSVASPTPLDTSARLSALTGAQVHLKREDLQPVRSYKIRGAYNLIAQLDDEQRSRGAVCASAGNHAQGVALACAQLGVDARIHLPRTTPRQKRDRVSALGLGRVTVVVDGETYDDAATAAYAEAERTGATIVPAFDDPRTIAGQGTIALEVVDQLGRAPDVLVVPVGGGGLLAGAITALQQGHPRTRIVGVEPAGAASMTAALNAGAPVTLDAIDGFADGTAVRRVGAFTFPIVRDSGCEMRIIAEGAICTEMLALYQSEGIIAEPSGAIASAALLELDLEPDSTVVAVLSGGNNDVSRYGEVVERALVHEGRKHYFLVEFPQEPGALRRFLDDVLGPEDDIALFEYVKRNSREYGPALVGVELGSAADLQPLLDRMKASPLVIERVPPDSPMFGFLL
ncbi:threonine ammonia-lyase IlvA [Allobranchiibius sp. GilTou73]|uniref:threonine ammonia-lyase IlvA n=1 Tax=Allobranchiibius sp. GilTou73 TaxID=2904523 RepID=UPI001F3F954A|nr:threonine ammonia-lyase IlvA [Allobranchiibius sp. GilTou73]UIJ35533.1 threonine ammonia-lyase IlvA [Allobranchiibius sp. GilTou73]